MVFRVSLPAACAPARGGGQGQGVGAPIQPSFFQALESLNFNPVLARALRTIKI